MQLMIVELNKSGIMYLTERKIFLHNSFFKFALFVCTIIKEFVINLDNYIYTILHKGRIINRYNEIF
jgi:hypothetical protein